MITSVTAVVCTRDRAQTLRDCLDSLLTQSMDPGLDWDVIVIDNGSKDTTPDVVRRAAAGAPVEVGYRFEGAVGLSGARNLGWRAAKGDVVAFLDDDATADPRWLQELVNGYASHDVAAVGGRLLPRAADLSGGTADPAWLRIYTYDRGDEPLDVADLSGSNMSFRRDVLARVGGFDPLLGRVGGCLLAGDENDVCRAIRRTAPDLRIVYVPRALAHHRVEADGQSDALLVKCNYCGGISNAIIDRKESIVGQCASGLRRLGAGGFWLLRLLVPRREGSALRLAARRAEFVGYARERMGGISRACSGCPMLPLRLSRIRVARSSSPSAGSAAQPPTALESSGAVVRGTRMSSTRC